jgi:hypothetical protein
MLGETPVPMPLLPSISHGLAWHRLWASTITGWRLTALGTVGPLKAKISLNCRSRFSSYRAVNTEVHMKHKCAQWAGLFTSFRSCFHKTAKSNC